MPAKSHNMGETINYIWFYTMIHKYLVLRPVYNRMGASQPCSYYRGTRGCVCRPYSKWQGHSPSLAPHEVWSHRNRRLNPREKPCTGSWEVGKWCVSVCVCARLCLSRHTICYCSILAFWSVSINMYVLTRFFFLPTKDNTFESQHREVTVYRGARVSPFNLSAWWAYG
jgi:hypothetical protein